MYKILLTGFEPFAGLETNVSEIVAEYLDMKSLNVELGESEIGTRRVRKRSPKIEWRSKILSVDKTGSTHISKDILSEDLKYSYVISDDAGGFVCNETLYNSLHALRSKDRDIPCIFVHLPSEEFMSINEQVEFVTRISAIVVQPRHVDVVGAIFENEGKWLASKRKGPIHSDKWEFPGGKIERGESENHALIRECKEELDWDITPLDRMMVIDYRYSDFTVTLHFWRCISHSDAPPSTHSHSEHRWIKTSMLHNFDWLEADIPLIEYIQSTFQS